MKKILFLIHDLGAGGAEKVLVNLVNNMNPEKFDITVMALFGGGVNEQFLKPHVKLINVFSKAFPGNSHVMKLLTPKQLHKWLIKDKYDIEVSYLEGPSARIISGCPNEDTKLVSWIHIEQHTAKRLAASFRNLEEAVKCYNRFDNTVCVSQFVKKDFSEIINFNKPCEVLYNTNETELIKELAKEELDIELTPDYKNLVSVGKLLESKGYMRLLSIIKRLNQANNSVRLYILGVGPLKNKMEEYITKNHLEDNVVFLNYQTNPYKYVSKCDLFVCSSFSEGFSTAATEALIVGTPVCTVEVSGMKEMLGENNEYGIVTENSEDALYEGIKKLIENPELLEHYRKQAKERSKVFTTEETVNAVEEMLESL
ncbi:MAG: glycosyltransferase [Ruminococcaceae bacterium]|nr:glycosyltransferase [Oscillospiraceae bacterium]